MRFKSFAPICNSTNSAIEVVTKVKIPNYISLALRTSSENPNKRVLNSLCCLTHKKDIWKRLV